MQINGNYAPQYTYGASQTQSAGATGRSGNDYLKELRERHPDADISIGGVGPGGLESYAWSKVGKFNDVRIHPDALERFANDPEGAAKMEAELSEFIGSEQRDRDILAAQGAELLGRGMTVDENGETTFWCIGQTSGGKDGGNSLMDKLGPKQSAREKAEEAQHARDIKAEEKKAEAAREKKREEREELLGLSANKTVFAQGKSVDELSLNIAAKLVNDGALDIKA